mmetsp:Transcript_39322/g.63784  ORF Transcript_39322/g.63784 Transcript_39322/m.63784 type:complete len:182 (-) Transcript_39322:700-1245(-)
MEAQRRSSFILQPAHCAIARRHGVILIPNSWLLSSIRRCKEPGRSSDAFVHEQWNAGPVRVFAAAAPPAVNVPAKAVEAVSTALKAAPVKEGTPELSLEAVKSKLEPIVQVVQQADVPDLRDRLLGFAFLGVLFAITAYSIYVTVQENTRKKRIAEGGKRSPSPPRLNRKQRREAMKKGQR